MKHGKAMMAVLGDPATTRESASRIAMAEMHESMNRKPKGMRMKKKPIKPKKPKEY